MKNRLWLGLALVLASRGVGPTAARGDFYAQTNLVSDIPGLAAFTDPNLKNPWGMSFSGGGPFWVSDQVTGKSTLYNGAGVPQGLIVTIPNKPGGGPPTGPTGQVFNPTNDFVLSNGAKAVFLFSNLDGTISGWNGTIGTTAEIHVTPTAPTVYTGLALGTSAVGSALYAADDRNGKIDVFNGAFAKTSLAGSFVDPTLPAGFTPYNIQNVGGTLYVTYENEGQGGGVVNAFDVNGNFLRRISANGAGGHLDSPWGVTLAPATFGQFGGKLLVGNEGDGHISAFDPNTGAFLGQLLGSNGNPIVNTGLWALAFGNAGAGSDPNALYFAAGINGEVDGLFGAIRAVPEPGSVVLFGLGGLLLLAGAVRKARGRRG